MAAMSQNLLKWRNQSGKRIFQGTNLRIQNDTSEGGGCWWKLRSPLRVQRRAPSVAARVFTPRSTQTHLLLVYLSVETEAWGRNWSLECGFRYNQEEGERTVPQSLRGNWGWLPAWALLLVSLAFFYGAGLSCAFSGWHCPSVEFQKNWGSREVQRKGRAVSLCMVGCPRKPSPLSEKTLLARI